MDGGIVEVWDIKLVIKTGVDFVQTQKGEWKERYDG